MPIYGGIIKYTILHYTVEYYVAVKKIRSTRLPI